LITAVEILLDNTLDHRTEITILLLEPMLIFSEEPLKIVKEYPVKHRVFRMTLAIDPCHGREDDSQNGPGAKKSLKNPIHLGCFRYRSDCLSRDVIRC
jgi:hypothetical protein